MENGGLCALHDRAERARKYVIKSLSGTRRCKSDKDRPVASSGMSQTEGPANQKSAARVEHCKTQYKELVEDMGKAISYREKISGIKEAAIKAMAALEMALFTEGTIEPHLSRLCAEFYASLTKGSTLVRIHGHMSKFKKVMRVRKDRVRESFEEVIGRLDEVAHEAWKLRELGDAYTSRLDREVSTTTATTTTATPERSRHSMVDNMDFFLVKKCIYKSKRFWKIHNLMYVEDRESNSARSKDRGGVVWWSAARGLYRYDVRSASTTEINRNMLALGVGCMTCDAANRVWTGHLQGEVKVWSKHSDAVLAMLKCCSHPIKCIAVDNNDIGWVGLPSGDVMRVRLVKRRNKWKLEMLGKVIACTQIRYMRAVRTQGGVIQNVYRSLVDNRALKPHGGKVRYLFAKDDLVLSSGGINRRFASLQVWNEDGKEIAFHSLAAFGVCDSMIALPWKEEGMPRLDDKWRLVTGHDTGELVLWVPRTLLPMVKIGEKASPVRDVFVCSCLDLIFAGHKDGTLSFHKTFTPDPSTPGLFTSTVVCADEELHQHKPPRGFFKAHNSSLVRAAGANDVVVTASAHGTVSIWPLNVLEEEAQKAGIDVSARHAGGGLRKSNTLTWLKGRGVDGDTQSELGAKFESSDDTSSTTDSLDFPFTHRSATPESPGLAHAVAFDAFLARRSHDGRMGHHSPRGEELTMKNLSAMKQGGVASPFDSILDTDQSNSTPTGDRLKLAPTVSEQLRETFLCDDECSDNVTNREGIIINPLDLQFDQTPMNSMGAGAFGVVYKGKAFMMDCAVKVLHTPMSSLIGQVSFNMGVLLDSDSESDEDLHKSVVSNKAVKALRHEATLMYNLRHPHIVMFLGVSLHPPCLVTEFCSKGSLFNLLQKAREKLDKSGEVMLGWPMLLRMAHDAALGMHYLHRHNVEHRDFKSPNLLVDGNWRVKVADFGTSKFLLSEQQLSDSIQATNPRWLGPEALKENIFGLKGDVYPYGIIMWELLTWRMPWEDSCHISCHPMQILNWVVKGLRPDIPNSNELPAGACPVFEEYVQLMEECWEQDPDRRPVFEEITERVEKMLLKVTRIGDNDSMRWRPVLQVEIPEDRLSLTPSAEVAMVVGKGAYASASASPSPSSGRTPSPRPQQPSPLSSQGQAAPRPSPSSPFAAQGQAAPRPSPSSPFSRQAQASPRPQPPSPFSGQGRASPRPSPCSPFANGPGTSPRPKPTSPFQHGPGGASNLRHDSTPAPSSNREESEDEPHSPCIRLSSAPLSRSKPVFSPERTTAPSPFSGILPTNEKFEEGEGTEKRDMQAESFGNASEIMNCTFGWSDCGFQSCEARKSDKGDACDTDSTGPYKQWSDESSALGNPHCSTSTQTSTIAPPSPTTDNPPNSSFYEEDIMCILESVKDNEEDSHKFARLSEALSRLETKGGEQDPPRENPARRSVELLGKMLQVLDDCDQQTLEVLKKKLLGEPMPVAVEVDVNDQA